MAQGLGLRDVEAQQVAGIAAHDDILTDVRTYGAPAAFGSRAASRPARSTAGAWPAVFDANRRASERRSARPRVSQRGAGLVARMVEPIAPSLAALRGV